MVCFGCFWGPFWNLVWFQVEFHHLICGKICTWERFKAVQCVAGFFRDWFSWLKQWQIILNAYYTHSDILTTKFVINKPKDYPSFWSCAMSVGVRKFETIEKFLGSFTIHCYLNGLNLSLSSQLVDFVPFARCQMGDQRHFNKIQLIPIDMNFCNKPAGIRQFNKCSNATGDLMCHLAVQLKLRFFNFN